MQVTIDGPAGVGKTSVGKKVAAKFSLLFVQSGLLYRALAYGEIHGLDHNSLSLRPEGGTEVQLKLAEKVLTDELVGEEIGEEASRLATDPEVRELVNDEILGIARENDLLVEGRDIGTKVLPNADLKVYLTASANERARRRKKQSGTDRTLEEIEAGIRKRDERDQNRTLAPLKPAKDAIIIDTTSLTEEEVVARISELIEDHS